MPIPARYFTAPLTLKEPEPDGATQSPSRFAGIAYSGDAVSDWGGRVVIDLSRTRIEPRLPLLHQHDPAAYIGVATPAVTDGQSLDVSGELFSDVDPRALEIATKAGRGAQYQMSIGLFEATPKTRKGDVTVNGRTIPGPVTILQGGIIREVSIVTLGADRSTSAAFFSTPTGTKPMSTDSDDAGQIADLKAQIAVLTARAETAEAELKAERTIAREAALSALFAEVGATCPDAAKPHYLEMSAAMFEAVSAQMRALKPAAPQAPAHLFKEQATGEPGTAPKPVIDMQAIYSARRAAK